jgi:excisionase family DNA binding protein
MAIKSIQPATESTGPNRATRRLLEQNKIGPGRRYASLKEAADYIGVTPRTCREWISEGRITGYRINARLVRVDLNELDAAMQPFGGAV